MEDTPTMASVRRYLSLLKDSAVPNDEELIQALDELALSYHLAPNGSPADEDLDPPGCDFEARYKAIAVRFPEYGHYAVAHPSEPLEQEKYVGDAIDDLADIARDLEEVVWRYDNVGTDDAHWYFKLLYRMHWGHHLRELTHYLHAKVYW